MTRYFLGVDPFHKQYGVSHFDDFFLLFDPAVVPIDGRDTEADKKVAEIYIDAIVNFATNHDPNGESLGAEWKR